MSNYDDYDHLTDPIYNGDDDIFAPDYLDDDLEKDDHYYAGANHHKKTKKESGELKGIHIFLIAVVFLIVIPITLQMANPLILLFISLGLFFLVRRS